MSTSDVVAIVAATVVTILVAVLATLLVLLARTLRQLRATLDEFRADAIDLLESTSDAAHQATHEIDRVERLLDAADKLDETKRAIATPVVKVMAFGTGVQRAAQRLRDGGKRVS